MAAAHSAAPTCWPDLPQELLLKAALLDGPDAVQAWEQWQTIGDLDHAGGGAFRLLPLVDRNLERIGVDHPDMHRLKGIRRRTWSQNELLFRDADEAIASLARAGIETLLLRGMALIARYYKDASLRPMNDCDILVPESSAEEADRALRSGGWKRITPAPVRLGIGFRRFRNSITYRNGRGSQLDLHWHVLSMCCSPPADREFWEGAEPAEIGGKPARVLNPADQLLHICLSGLEWTYTPFTRWVADAMTILRSSEPIDWERFQRFARRHRLQLPLHRALEYLETMFHFPLPAGARTAETASRADRLEYDCLTLPYRRRSPAAWLVGAQRRHWRSESGSFARYLATAVRWGAIPHVRQRVLKIS